MKAPQTRLVISALRGGAGKTTLSAGILAALSKRGIKTAPFKKGPDYIDAAWLSCASGRQCHNLDSFLMGNDTILSSFARYSDGADLALIEGNRGLFDGADASGTHSTAELAKLLTAPVVMIMDCDKVTRTAAAMLLGCRVLSPEVKIRGVILNRVSGSRHEGILRMTIEETCRLPVIGAVPRMKDFPFPERNMGLTPPQEHTGSRHALETASGIAEKYIDLDRILGISSKAPSFRCDSPLSNSRANAPSGARIGVFKDSAFQFYYPENLAALRDRGADIVDISPLNDSGLPDVDLLYIGGGFPETHAGALAGNAAFNSSVRVAAEAGLPIYAECGGLMYLGEHIVTEEGKYPMAGALPVSFAMLDRPQGHGYTIMDVVSENPYFNIGTTIRGHEFHHSRIISIDKKNISFAFRMKRGKGADGIHDGLCRNRILGCYTHVHALGTPEWADAIIGMADAYKLLKERSVSNETKHGTDDIHANRFLNSTSIQQ